MLGEERGDEFHRFGKRLQQFRIGQGRVSYFIAAFASVIALACECGERLAQIFEDAAVIYNQAVVLAFVDAVGAGDGLQEGVGFKRFIEVESGEAGHVETRQPHGADDGNAEGVVILLESRFKIDTGMIGQFKSIFDEFAMREDIQFPLAEGVHFALFFADDDCHARFFHPLDLTQAIDFLLLIFGGFDASFQRCDLILPVGIDQPVKADCGDLIDADQHGFAAFPGGGVVRDEIARDLFEALLCGEDVIVAFEFAFEALFEVDVFEFDPIELLGDAFVEVVGGDAEFVAARVVVERDCGFVFDGALEVVGGDVLAEDLLGDLVILEERRACEAHVAGVGQGVAHVEREQTVLSAVRFVGDDDEIFAYRHGFYL